VVVYNKNHAWHVEIDTPDSAEILLPGSRREEVRNNVNKLIHTLNKSKEDDEAGRTEGDDVGGEVPEISLLKVE